MSDWMEASGSIVSGVGGFLSDIFFNRQRQKLQQKIFRREDTAVRRRAYDMEQAGLSKTLAAGDGAGAGAVVNTQAPEVPDLGQSLAMVRESKRMKADISATEANRDYTKQQKRNAEKQWDAIDLDIKAKEKENRIRDYNLDYASKHSLPYGANPSGYQTLIPLIETLINKYKESPLQEKVEEIVEEAKTRRQEEAPNTTSSNRPPAYMAEGGLLHALLGITPEEAAANQKKKAERQQAAGGRWNDPTK